MNAGNLAPVLDLRSRHGLWGLHGFSNPVFAVAAARDAATMFVVVVIELGLSPFLVDQICGGASTP